MRVPRLRLALALGLMLGALAAPFSAAAQTGGFTSIITQVDASGFPAVSFDLRAVENNQPVGALNNTTLAVYENGQPMPNALVTPLNDGPLTVIFVVDLGRLSNYSSFGLNNLRAMMTTLVEGGFFVDGRDTVAVYTRKNVTSDQTIEAVPPTTSASDFTTRIATFDFAKGGGSTKGLLGLEEAIAKVGQQVPVAGSRTAAIIYITRYIEDPINKVARDAAHNTAALALQRHIPLYVFQTDAQQVNQDTLNVLTGNTFGQYVPLNRNTVVAQVSAVYTALNAQRAHYAISYTSTSGAAGTRQITINAPAPLANDVAGLYDIDPQPPTAALLSPTPDSTIRRETQTGGGAFDANSLPVQVSLGWADNHPRTITAAELYASGVLEDSEENIPPGTTQIELTWDLTDVVNPGVNDIPLEVRLTDELGLTTNLATTIHVQVIVLAPTARPSATPTSTPTPSLIAVATRPTSILGLIVCVLLAAVVAFGAVMVFILRPRPAAGAPTGAVPPTAPVSNQQTLIGGVAPTGTLTVMAGPPNLLNQSIVLDKPQTKLGRNPAMVEVAFYAEEQSSVSRWHCTIHNNLGTYQIVDNNSSSGTFVNGRRLASGAASPLAEGAEIVLGDLNKNGVRLRFTYGAGGGGGVSSDRTFIYTPGDDQNWDKFSE